MKALVARLVFWSCVSCVWLWVGDAHAYAWMIRHGFAECGSCHVDPMGGETLSGMGRVMGERLLAQRWSAEPPTPLAELAFGVPEPDDVRLGGSFRGMAVSNLGTDRTRAFPMQADLYGAAFFDRFRAGLSLGLSRASNRHEHSSKARLIGDVADEGVLLVSRSHWLGYAPNDALLLRAGRLNLPFGIRGSEHTAWVRSETQTDRESDQLHGVAAAYNSGPLRGELFLSLGNLQAWDPAYQQRGYSLYAELLLLRRLAVGVSSMLMVAPRELEVDRGPFSRQAHGLTVRYSPWTPVVVLGELDLLKQTGAGLGHVGMFTLDIEPLQGLHVSGSYEVLDHGRPDVGASAWGYGRQRVGKWLTLNWFFGPHLDLRIDLVQRDQREDLIQTQLHLYL